MGFGEFVLVLMQKIIFLNFLWKLFFFHFSFFFSQHFLHKYTYSIPFSIYIICICKEWWWWWVGRYRIGIHRGWRWCWWWVMVYLRKNKHFSKFLDFTAVALLACYCSYCFPIAVPLLLLLMLKCWKEPSFCV